MKLFIIESPIATAMPIFAGSVDEAAGHYVGWEIAQGVKSHEFTVERQTLGLLPANEAQHLREALRTNISGYGTYHPAWGWVIRPPAAD